DYYCAIWHSSACIF
nr:immunoglobulin light chain junction region [Macaca mulatta]MOW27642.1 immunoglobulin light chain junction region [Macaca mulatta]MOW27807.1 immunoglobulin light chain junction region [Macaca mulatta]MOW27955.1 immunoglobulin light chain junction region [Macaca mulatta]MOW28013.1 immunoglobulin light chain junction region [Macaca mulatta]